MSRATNLLRALPALVAGIMVCGAGAATAQQPQTRSGFLAALGLGYGADMLTCSGGCSFNSDSKGGSGTISLKLGGTPKSTLRLGGEVNLWVKDVAGVTEAVGNIPGAVYLYPIPRSGFLLKASVGVASFELRRTERAVQLTAAAIGRMS